MIFTSRQEAAQKLISKLESSGLKDAEFFHLTPESETMAQFVAGHFQKKTRLLSALITKKEDVPKKIVIIDDGGVDAEEINEYTDILRKKNKKTNIALAIAVIAAQEQKRFEEFTDQLIYLHSEPLFFNINQFYQT